MYFYENLSDDLIRIGVNDRRISRFENMYPIPNGISYNSYLIKGETNTLFDTVDPCFIEQFMENLEGALAGEDLDYLVITHMEPDHSTAVSIVMQKYPNCKIIGNAKTFQFLDQFFHVPDNDNRIVVKDGESMDIGTRTLTFKFAPMVHWPEVMFVQTCKGELFTADAFGVFGAIEGHVTSDLIDMNEEFFSEARRYYINIVGKFGRNTANILKKIDLAEVKMILPLHGPVHRDGEKIKAFVEKYQKWAAYEPEENGVCIVCATMYGNTMLAAEALAHYLSLEGVKNIKVYDVSNTDFSYIVSQAHRLSNLVITPINYNTVLYPKMDAFLRDLVMTGYSGRNYSTIVNGSWGGRSEAMADEILEKSKMTKIGNPVVLTSAASQENMEELRALTKEIKASFK